MDPLLNQVKHIVAKISGIAADEIPEDATFEQLELDSLSRIEVLVELERQYKLNIPETEFTEEDLVTQIQSVRHAAELIAHYVTDAS